MTAEFTYRLTITGPKAPWIYEARVGITTIGRGRNNNLLLAHPRVSGNHARLECTPTECWITDLASTNGTYINGEQLATDKPRRLVYDAVIKIGPFEITFEWIPVKIAPPPPLPPLPDLFESDPVLREFFANSRLLLDHLPDIYDTGFMIKYLRAFETILLPIKWNVDNFDLYLNPGTAPADFLPWLANCFDITFDSTWDESKRRKLLAEVGKIYARRGTLWALRRVLEIYTGHTPEIDDGNSQPHSTFTVRLPMRGDDIDRAYIEALIDAHKPVHTSYRLEFIE